MIRYGLQCADGHAFEAWFKNSAAFDDQASRGLLSCPDCGGSDVRKAIMAPNVSPRTRHRGGDAEMPARREAEPEAPTASHPPAAIPVTNELVAEHAAKVVAFLRAVRQAVEAHAENVGEDFADEARKIHYGEADERPIYGEATIQDAVDLIEEGIAVNPLPILPEDRN